MKITLNEEESESYLDLQENYDNIRGVLLLEAEKAIARDEEIATLTSTVQELQASLEAKERSIAIQDTASITRDSFKMDSERHRVERDTALVQGIESESSATVPDWLKPKQTTIPADPTPTNRAKWSAEDAQEFRDFILLTGKYGPSYREVSFLASHFNRTEDSIKSRVYETFNGTRYIRKNTILTRHTPPKGKA